MQLPTINTKGTVMTLPTISLELWFDLRNPSWTKRPTREVYAAALDICEWADTIGFQAITIGEHHGANDDYCSSPIQMAGLIGGRTKKLQLRMIILTPFYNPLRLAEDLAVLNLATNGRAIPVFASGYLPSEYDMFGVLRKDRGAACQEAVEFCRKAWSGKSFSYRGRDIEAVTPVPDPVPRLLMGASYPPMIRKAAAIADGLSPAEIRIYEMFREERIKLGKSDPGPMFNEGPNFLFISEDPERDWTVVAPHWLHTTQGYQKNWDESAEKIRNDRFPAISNIDDMKRNPQAYRVVTPDQCLQMIEALGDHSSLHFNPLHAGLDPAVAWRSLRLLEEKVLPHVTLKADYALMV